MSEESTETDPYTLLSIEERDSLNDLIELGHVSTEVSYAGHTFGLRTLHIDEELAAAKAISNWSGTPREHIAWATSVVAMSLTHVDGDPDFCPAVAKDVSTNAIGRFNYVSKSWHWPVVELLYSKVAELAQEQAGILKRAENLSGSDLGGSFDVAEALIAQGIFNDETPGGSL